MRRVFAGMMLLSAVPSAPARAVERGPLVCDKPQIQVGETESSQQKHKFELRNVSDETVQITATHKACGCVKRDLTTYTVPPGESTELTLDFPIRTTPGTLGDFVERMEVYINNQHESPAVVVSVSGRLVPTAYRLRDAIYIEAPKNRGDEFKGKIDVFLNKARGVRIESIEALGALPIKAEITGREDAVNDDEEKAVLQVSGKLPNDAELPATARILVKLNNKQMPEMEIPVTLYRKSSHTVRFSPQMLAFGVLPADGKVKRVVSIELPKGGSYAVQEATPSGEGVTVAIEEKAERSHVALLRCELDAGKMTGKVEQQLLVTIAVPDGPPEVYKLPISGFVKRAEGERAKQATEGADGANSER